MPEITVAITTHNLENYIKICLSEILQQSFRSFEILIYDDCSTDNTKEILLDFAEKNNEQIKVILGNIPLKSPALARNAILDSGWVRGKYIVFLDGDDNIENDFLEKLYNAAELNNAQIAICSYERFEDKTEHVLCREMQNFPIIVDLPTESDILAFVNGSLWNKLILVDCIGTKRLPNFNVGEDLSFLLALYDKCERITFVDKILIHYRVRSASVISNMPETTVYKFAEELLRLWSITDKKQQKEVLELISFIHIGISMPLRIFDNPNENLNQLLDWCFQYFKQNYNWFKKNRFLKINSLIDHGIKGLGLWFAKICWRLRCFKLFLCTYKFITKFLHIDIKF